MDGTADYDVQASELAPMFVDNFKTFEAEVTAEVTAAGPRAIVNQWELENLVTCLRANCRYPITDYHSVDVV